MPTRRPPRPRLAELICLSTLPQGRPARGDPDSLVVELQREIPLRHGVQARRRLPSCP